ncbi:hypothetical protein AB5N19_12158 [Seiridium cardinale]
MSRPNLAIKYPSSAPSKRVTSSCISSTSWMSSQSLKKRIHAWSKDEEGREDVSGLNGRQICNIVFSAARMSAVQEGGRLSSAAIKQFTQATKKFSLDIQIDMAASRVKNEPMNSTM